MIEWRNLPPLFDRPALHRAALDAADASPAGQPWCLALSGGADSLALLLLVWTHWPERRDRLTALHFNHGLRGTASDGDEQFCREACADLGVEFSSAKWLERPERPGEAEAREARQAFFAREMTARAASVLWTGHQKDDIAETQLMRLARGAGTAGLAAPRPVSCKPDGRVFLRPLLTLTKGEIMAALTDRGIRWREDATNATREYFRTRVRYDVLPRLQDAACNNVLGGAALTRELCEEDDEALEFWIKQLGVVGTPERLDLRPLRGLPRALWRRALRRWEPTATLSRHGFEELLSLCESGRGRISAGNGFLQVDDAEIFWSQVQEKTEEWGPVSLGQGASVALPDGAEIRAANIELSSEQKEKILGGKVDSSTEAYLAGNLLPFQIRTWRNGDRFRSLGAPGSAKLQDLFVNRKIPAELRSRLPVVFAGDGEILWVPGLPPAERAKITMETRQAVQLTYRWGTSTLNHQSPNP